ncbi:unnamed protein product [Bursaphelenchus xylophilus]|uniref:Large ribosomal subunit protein mL64 n=1 Tax=Bursaphelenchus xylophilus TaxID=6326 RepID=A0A1I7RVM1_BURXY|nr:unnamed protein product [Bursaphelenchus xylophilus]CAG9081877.1 unnamed protein product [Bursaphelenchus xylophilus]
MLWRRSLAGVRRYSSENKKRIPSGLKEIHQTQIEGGIPPLNYEQQRDKVWLGRQFGRYGLAANIELGKLWPTVEEINEINELKFYRPAKEAVELAQKIAKEEEARKRKHIETVKKNLQDYDKVLSEYKESLNAPPAEKTPEELANERRMQEIQEYFGYWIDPSDPRFEVMLKQKEAEEAKAEKMAKKEEKKKRTVAATS